MGVGEEKWQDSVMESYSESLNKACSLKGLPHLHISELHNFQINCLMSVYLIHLSRCLYTLLYLCHFFYLHVFGMFFY